MKHKIKSIGSRISLSIGITSIVTAIILAVLGGLTTYDSTVKALHVTLLESADIASVAVENELRQYEFKLQEMAATDYFASSDVDEGKILDYLEQRREANDLTALEYVEGNDTEHASTDYLKAALSGEFYVSEPFIEKDKAYVHMSYPVKRDGKIVGALVATEDTDFIQNMLGNMVIGESEYADCYIISGTGLTVASLEYDLVLEQENLVQEIAAGHDDYYDMLLANVEQSMIDGKHDIDSYIDADGVSYSQAYSPIEYTNGWSVAVVIDRDEYMNNVKSTAVLDIIVVIVVACVSGIIGKRVSKRIAVPLNNCVSRMNTLATGDIYSEFKYDKTGDETQKLAESIETAINTLKHVVEDIDDTLTNISEGNLNVQVEHPFYTGDFKRIDSNFMDILKRLRSVVTEIQASANTVLEQANGLGTSSQSLANGSEEQTAEIQQILSTFDTVDQQVSDTQRQTEDVLESVNNVVTSTELCNQRVDSLRDILDKIADNSTQISGIVDVINGITSQTNLLALNAAIEAARAGDSGKGFAVVADAVRDLSHKTKESSDSITPLLKESQAVIDESKKLMLDTLEALEEVSKSSIGNKVSTDKIVHLTAEESNAISQLTESINQVAEVVQENTVLATQNAEISDKLLTNAKHLKDIISYFKVS